MVQAYLCIFGLVLGSVLGQFLSYSDKLAHIQVVFNWPYFVAQSCAREDGLAYILGTPTIDDVMSYDSLTILIIECPVFKWFLYSS